MLGTYWSSFSNQKARPHYLNALAYCDLARSHSGDDKKLLTISAKAYHGLGNCRGWGGEEFYLKELEVRIRQFELDPESSVFTVAAAAAHCHLGNVFWSLDRGASLKYFADALFYYKALLKQRLDRMGDALQESAASFWWTGRFLMHGDPPHAPGKAYSLACDYYQICVNYYRRLVEVFPDDARMLRNLVSATGQLADSVRLTDDKTASELDLQKARLMRRVEELDHTLPKIS